MYFKLAILSLFLAGCVSTVKKDDVPVPPIFKVDDYRWQDHLQLSDVGDRGWSGNNFGSAYYKDVMSHASRKITGYSAMTNAHETNHMLNNEVRNATGEKDNTIYLDNGKAALVLEPKMNSGKIRNYLPEFVKKKASSRYQTYLVNQTSSWPEVLYQFDEWGAYRTDARVVDELVKAGTFDQARQGEVCTLDGAIEFMYFGSAAVQALKVNEPDYLQYEQFKAGYALLAEQTMEYFKKYAGDQKFDCSATPIFDHFRDSSENKEIRETLREWLGAQFTERVWGF